jgi:hypothetical protein
MIDATTTEETFDFESLFDEFDVPAFSACMDEFGSYGDNVQVKSRRNRKR